MFWPLAKSRGFFLKRNEVMRPNRKPGGISLEVMICCKKMANLQLLTVTVLQKKNRKFAKNLLDLGKKTQGFEKTQGYGIGPSKSAQKTSLRPPSTPSFLFLLSSGCNPLKVNFSPFTPKKSF